MVQEQADPRIVALERKVKALEEQERLRALGLVGSEAGDLQAQITQQRSVLASIVGDRTLGNVLLGSFPEGFSSTGFRRADGDFYPSGCLNNLTGTASNLPIATGDLHATPFYMPDLPNVVDEVMFSVTTAEAGKLGRIGLYADNGSVYPGRLLFDAGEVSIATTGFKKFTLSESVPRGLVWVIVTLDSAGVARLHGNGNGIPGSWLILGGSQASNTTSVGWRVNSAYGPLPAIYPAGAVKRQELVNGWISFKAGGYA